MGPQRSPPLIHPILCLPLQQLFPPFCALDTPLRQWGAHKAFQASHSPPVAPGWGFFVPITLASTGHSDVPPGHSLSSQSGICTGMTCYLGSLWWFLLSQDSSAKPRNEFWSMWQKRQGWSLGKLFLPLSNQSRFFPALPPGTSMPGGSHGTCRAASGCSQGSIVLFYAGTAF